MEAELFCLNRDLAAAGMLTELLRDKVDQSITLTVHNMEVGEAWVRFPLASRYAKLLQATIPPSRGMHVHFTAMDWFENRIYLRIYWPMHVSGHWEDVAGTSVFFEGYHVDRGVMCSANPNRGLELFFPALAVRDRMVLIPRGQDALLTQIGIPSAEQDELPRDVLEVDFGDQEAVERAMTTLSQRLVAEIRREVAAYMVVHPGTELDVSALSAELAIGPALFERSMKEEASIYEQLSFELTQRRFIQGRWTKTGLVVRNNSPSHIPQLRVTITGPDRAEVEPREMLVEISPHSEVVQDVSIRPADPGELPLRVAVVLSQHELLALAFAPWLSPPTYLWIESTPQ